MINTWFAIIIETSAFAVITILLVAGIGRWTGHRYRLQWRYWIWLVLGLRLALPFWQVPQSVPVLTLPNIVVDQLTSNSGPSIVNAPSSEETSTEASPIDESWSAANTDTSTSGYIPDILTLLSWIWLLGAASYLCWRLLQYHLVLRRLKACSQSVGPRELARLSSLKSDMGVNRRIGLYQCRLASSPMLIGYIRPSILLPDTRLTDEQLELILRHELTHAKRKDLWFMALMTWVSALHWFNPFVHWMIRMAYDDLEKICDSHVIKHADVHTRQLYANTIIHYMENSVNKGPSLSTSFLGGDRVMKERFKLIFQNQPQKSAAWISSLLLIIILAGGTLVSCQSQSAQSKGKNSFAGLYALFGSSEQEVFAALSLDADNDAEKTDLNPDSAEYLLKQPVQVHGHSSQLQLGFYNDLLMYLQYRFDNHQDAFAVSKALRDELAKLHGQPDTMDGHPNRLDTLTALPTDQALPSPDYLEEWHIEVDPEVLTTLIGDTDYSALDVVVRLSLLDESHASVTVRYSANLNSLQTPRP
ncbi:M56 family metallopeptidase [Paenibacillus sp. J2TS4]|uniref:M56 family metallopeptidase n=1 Tax=Paenibacillus sp. J2TS4 TaxID=2807194 RepID=UPI001B20EB6E|nr:M56 family metallopeptidase [Paenibacillus sp. J2TS4]GIP32021.1 hypothetical protein J2TS4_12310 [Paenibacillus sp. J2TS4]